MKHCLNVLKNLLCGHIRFLLLVGTVVPAAMRI